MNHENVIKQLRDAKNRLLLSMIFINVPLVAVFAYYSSNVARSGFLILLMMNICLVSVFFVRLIRAVNSSQVE